MNKLTEETRAIMDERFGGDNLISLATAVDNMPYVRTVNACYIDGSFYIITHALSGKMEQLRFNPAAAISGDWFTARGTGESLGWFGSAENAALAQRLREVFAGWIDNGHNNFEDENTIILRIRLESGILFHHGTRYDIDFTNSGGSMAKIYAICGKICSGKSTYCEALKVEKRAMLLSVDELMLGLFDPALGENHEAVSQRAQSYLLERARELASLGVDVILDWGFWSRESREKLRRYCGQYGIALELHYLHLSDQEWERRIAQRNAQVQAGRSDAYLVDEGLMEKFRGMFQEPLKGEADIWFEG